jgi:hypothetical protein
VTQEKTETWQQLHSVARYGSALRYPLCCAGLSLWETDAFWLRLIKESLLNQGARKDSEHQRNQAKSLIAQLRKARKADEAKQVSHILEEVEDVRRKLETADEANRQQIPAWRKIRTVAEQRFATESVAALRAHNFPALRALERAWKAWKQPNNQPQYRKLEILRVIRDGAVQRAWNDGGAASGYWEIVSGPDRLLSDNHWPRFTARQLHEHLVAVNAFSEPQNEEQASEQLHQVRRLAKQLGIRLLSDRRGPKRKLNKRSRN